VEAKEFTEIVMSESTWYYTENGQQIGPVSFESLQDKRRQIEEEPRQGASSWVHSPVDTKAKC